MLTDGTTTVINSMKENGVKRLAVVTSIGAGDSKDQVSLFKCSLVTFYMYRLYMQCAAA